MKFDDLYEILVFLFVIGAFIIEAIKKGKSEKSRRRPTRQAPQPHQEPRESRPQAQRPQQRMEPMTTRDGSIRVYKTEDAGRETVTGVFTPPKERVGAESVEMQAKGLDRMPTGEQALEKLGGLKPLAEIQPLKRRSLHIEVKRRRRLPALSKKEKIRQTFLMMELLQPPKSLRKDEF